MNDLQRPADWIEIDGVLACGHDGPALAEPVCAHVVGCKAGLATVRFYVGVGLSSELLCISCADVRARDGHVAVSSICEECFRDVISDYCDPDGVRGAPGILERAEPIDATLARTPLPPALGTIVDLAPIDGDARSAWLLLAEDGRLARFDAAAAAHEVLAVSALAPEPERQPWAGHVRRRRLHVSARGEFAAVVNDYGRHGQLIDLRSGRATLALDGGDYHGETVPFSFAFFETGGRTLAIHRTAWNRLDLSDPATGALLTQRGPTRYKYGEEEKPLHHLDYFHGGLHVSPNGTRVLDDGWVWHPIGIPTTWSLQRWARDNPWESEDGPSKLRTCFREYHWDVGCVWLDEERVAVGGIGDDDDAIVDGVRLFDATATGKPGAQGSADARVAREVMAFAGPAGLFFSDGARLFSSDASGLSRWEVGTGARTGRIPGFQPTRHHRGAGELTQLADGALVRWRIG